LGKRIFGSPQYIKTWGALGSLGVEVHPWGRGAHPLPHSIDSCSSIRESIRRSSFETLASMSAGLASRATRQDTSEPVGHNFTWSDKPLGRAPLAELRRCHALDGPILLHDRHRRLFGAARIIFRSLPSCKCVYRASTSPTSPAQGPPKSLGYRGSRSGSRGRTRRLL
jgi:hypothetical protein